MNPRSLVLLVVLFGAAAGSWWLTRSPQRSDPDSGINQEALPGYYLRDATILGTGEDGRLLYQIEAEDIRQAPSEDSVYLEQVRISYAQPGQADWTVSAREGSIAGSGERIELRGDVELTSAEQAVGNDLVIRTQTLSFQPRERIASTADAVSITQRGNELTAIGMEADLNAQLLRLKSDVSGTFRP